MEFLYIRSNPDWDLLDKYKFGYVGSQENGLINRLKSSITEYCQYVMIYGIDKEYDYELVKIKERNLKFQSFLKMRISSLLESM